MAEFVKIRQGSLNYFRMRQGIIFFLGVITALLSITSCQKDDETNRGAQSAAEAEFRLGSASKWIITDAKLNNVYILKDKVLLDPDQDGIAEWLIFDTTEKTIEVKYPREDETTFFNYIIVNDIFKVFHKDGFEEIMSIRSGSVFVDRFILEQSVGMTTLEVTLHKQ